MSGYGTPARVDTSRPHPARVHDRWLGGEDDYPVDEEPARRIWPLTAPRCAGRGPTDGSRTARCAPGPGPGLGSSWTWAGAARAESAVPVDAGVARKV